MKRRDMEMELHDTFDRMAEKVLAIKAERDSLWAQVERLTQEKRHAQAEVAACTTFLSTELGWEWFRIEQLYRGFDDEERRRCSQDNARQLSNYLKDSGHGIAFLKEVAALQSQVRTLREALEAIVEDGNEESFAYGIARAALAAAKLKSGKNYNEKSTGE